MGLLQEISGDEKKPVIDTPGEPHGVVAETATAEPDKIYCSHLRTKKVLLIGTDPTGALNWGDVESAIQCVECACILRESCPQ
jgi:hypothetical protein